MKTEGYKDYIKKAKLKVFQGKPSVLLSKKSKKKEIKGPKKEAYRAIAWATNATLESGIDVGQGINVGPGKLGKKNKRRALNTHVLCSE